MISTEGLQWTSEQPTDPGIAILRTSAHQGGILSEYFSNLTKQNYILYAVDDLAVHATTRSLGYKIRGAIPSQLTVSVTTNGEQIIPAGSQLVKELSDGTSLYFETQSDLVFTAAGTKRVYVLQGQTFTSTRLGILVELLQQLQSSRERLSVTL